jgi:hypothetical protein
MMSPADVRLPCPPDRLRVPGALQLTHGDTLPRAQLQAGFDFEGRKVPFLAPQGIFKPAILDFPLSITTTPPSSRKPRPYADEVGPDDLLRYKYRGADQAIATTWVCAKR